MKKILFLLLSLWMTVSAAFAQTDRSEQAWRAQVASRLSSESFTPFDLASGPDLSAFAKGVTYLKINSGELDRLLTENPRDLKITIPIHNGSPMSLELFPSGILTDDFSAWTPDGPDNKGIKKFPMSHNGLHYWGIVAGRPGTTAAISFFQNEIIGVIMTPEGNYNIGILGSEKTGDRNALYAFYNDRNVSDKIPFSCGLSENKELKSLQKMKDEGETTFAQTTCRAVRIYFEADKDLHDKRGGVANTVTFITGFFNVVGAMFANENITLQLGNIKVWNVTDPYVTFTTTNQFLDEFRNNQIPPNPHVWNLAHLVSTRLNIGGLAYLNVLCNNDRGIRSGFSAISNSFQQLPAYSFTVSIITHELGHNFSSPHTQSCLWPGGAIDGCVAVEDGACPQPPPVNPGTVMSYCGTVDLNLGFGPLPGNRIRRAYQNATCLPTTLVTASIISPANPFRLCQGNNVTLTANSDSANWTYQWQRDGVNIAGATNSTHTTNLPGTYTVVVRRFACRAVSEPLNVTLINTPCGAANGTITGGVSLACGSTPSGTLTLAGHTGTIVRWESSTDNFNTAVNINSTTNTITYPLLNASTCYRAVIDNGGTTFSAPRCIVIAPPPTVTAGIDVRALCQDTVGTLWANSPNAISYVWTPATGLNNANISHPFITLAVSTTYTVVATDNNGCTASATVAVTLSPTAGAASAANGALCIGDQASLTLAGPITGTITWQQRVNCTGTWVTAVGSGVNTPNFTSNAFVNSGSICYRARLTQGTCVYVSNVVTVTICGDVRFTCTGLTYTQNFNSWNPSTPNTSTCFGGNGIGWADDSSIPGFYLAAARGTLNINTRENANCVAWGIVNLGINGNNDRALGTVTRNTNGQELGMIGIKCRNNTGSAINTVALNYIAEQWYRDPNFGLPADRLDFQYSLDATALTNGTWTDFNALDAVSPQLTNGFQLDGNLAANRANVTGTITGLSIPDGANFWLRWVDFDTPGLTVEDALGLEDLNITVTRSGLTPPVSVTRPIEHCANENKVYTISPVVGNGTVTYNWTIPGGCTGWSLQSPNGTSATTMTIRSGSANCTGISVTATDACGTSAPFNFNITLDPCSPSVGGTVSADQSVCQGTPAATLTLTGQVGNVLRWESSTDNFTTVTTINNTTTTYAPGVLAQTTCFRAVVQTSPPSANSTPACVTVAIPGFSGTVGPDQTVCPGATVSLFLSNQGGNVIRWESSSDNFATVTTINHNTATLTFLASAPNKRYRAVSQAPPCAAIRISANALVAVTPPCGSIGGDVTANQTICRNTAPATLNLINNTGNVVRWESSTDNFTTVTTITNTNTNYSPGVLTQTTCFRAVVLDNPPAANSNPACITVELPGSAGIMTSDRTLCAGVSTTLLLIGSSGNIIRWESSTDNFATVTTIARTSATYTFNASAPNKRYRAVIQNTPCNEIFSTSVEVVISCGGSVGGTVSANQTVCAGTAAAALNLTGQVGNVVRWESSTDNFTTVTTISNTNASYSPGVLTQNTCFRAVVLDVAPEANSTAACITVVNPGVAGTVNNSQTVCESVSVTLNLTGHSGTILRWESSTDNFTTVTNIPHTNASYTFNASTPNKRYRAVIQNAPCNPVFSGSAEITIGGSCGSVGGTVSADQTICTGNAPAALNLTGHNGNVIRWERSTDNFNTLTTINNITTTYSPGVLTQTTCFRAVVLDNPPSANSTPACITVLATPPSGGTIASFATVCRGNNTGTLTLSGQVGNIIRWEVSTNNFTSFTTVNNTTVNLTYTNLTADTWYRVRVQNPGCPAVNSAVVRITTVLPAIGGTVSSNQTVCPNAAGATLRLTGFSGTIVRWERSNDNFATLTTINNVTGLLNPGIMTQTTQFRAVVQNVCGAVNSSSVQITVPVANVGTLSQNMTLCSTPGSGTLTLTGNAGTVQGWEGSVDNFVTIQPFGILSNTFNFTNLTNTTSYRVRLSINGCRFYSNPVTVTVVPSPRGGTLLSNQTICEGQNASPLILSNVSGNIIRWESSTDNFATVNTINHQSLIYTPNPVNVTTSFRAVVGRAGCPELNSTIATITVGAGANGGTVISSHTICTGQSPALLTLMGHIGTVIRWESSTDNFTTVNPINHTLTTYQPPMLNATTSFRALINGGVCGQRTSSPVTITVIQGPEGGFVGADQTICFGNTPNQLVLTGYTGTVVQWESSTDNFTTVTTIANTNDTYSPGPLSVSTRFRAAVTNGGCGNVNSASALISVTMPPTPPMVTPPNATYCFGQSPSLHTASHINGGTFDWYTVPVGGTPIFTGASYNVPTNMVGTYFYYVENTSVNGCRSNRTAVIITVENGIAVGGTVSSDMTLCANDMNVYTLNLSGQVGNVIRWEASEDGFNSISTFANTNTSHQFAGLRATTQFRAVVGVPGCNEEFSSSVTVTMTSPQENGILTDFPGGQIGNCAGGTGTLRLTNYTGSVLRWESSTDNFMTVTTIANATDNLAYNVAVTTRFRAVIDHPVCGPIFSPVIQVSPGITVNTEAWRECNAFGKIVAVGTGGSSPYSYSISPQAGVQSQVGIFTNLPVGTYTVTVRDRFGCTATSTIAIPGTVSPPRIFNIVALSNTASRVFWDVVQPGGVNVLYQLQHRPVGGGAWSAPIQTNATNMIITGLQPNTLYEVQVRVRCLPSTLWNAWSPSSTFRTLIRDGETNVETLSDLSVYPNPNKGSFVLSGSGLNEHTNLTLVDPTGRTVWQGTYSENEIQIPGLASGVYLLRVNERYVKIVVE